VIFTFMLGQFAAGLVIYWAWNNILSMSQQAFIMYRQGMPVGRKAIAAAAARDAAAAAAAKEAAALAAKNGDAPAAEAKPAKPAIAKSESRLKAEGIIKPPAKGKGKPKPKPKS